jgi:hypothetical protein
MANSSNKSQQDIIIDLMELEYKALRDEKLKLIEMRQHVIEITLTLAAAFFGIAFIKEAPPTIAMVYPPIAAFLAIGWVQLDYRIYTVSNFIRIRIESYSKVIFFETWMHEGKKDLEKKQGTILRYVSLSHYGVFLFTQLFAMLIGFIAVDSTSKNFRLMPISSIIIVLAIIDIFSILVTYFAFAKAEYKNEDDKKKEAASRRDKDG